ncbi:hypothetical protein Dda_2750 [Drechslerella dactyloides]|uniref:tRNA/rRNA methyltransferase SpoU type domain-containing protein n=1 Tax=Drechslerella dactyloides TaxID=74499 RepID=A0AAD6J0L1_DREDA|nr:hypothetical protein Dda_2750 [Drechslerella dactyloides]
MAMSRDIQELPSTTILLESLQDDSKGLDIFAYLLGLQADEKSNLGSDPRVPKLAERLYNFVFYPKGPAQDIRQRFLEATELLRRHDKLRLRNHVLSILVPELLLLLRLCLLNCKDEYGPDFSKIYATVPIYSGTLEGSTHLTLSTSEFDAELEFQQIEAQADKRLLPSFESKSTILQATKDRFLFLEDLLSEQDIQLGYLVTEQPLFTTSLTRLCMSATYVVDQSITLSSVRLLRRVNSLHSYFLKNSSLKNQHELDSTIFGHAESLLQSKHKMQINAGYHLWVGLLDSHSERFNLSSIIHTESYWGYILNGLNGGSGEVKKICLHILWSSLQQLTESLELRNFRWSIKDKASLLDFWKTYITFVEMIALDNSVKQLRLASAELESLIRHAHTIRVPGEWILVLLSQGLDNSSVGDMLLRLSELILRLDTEALWWIKNDRKDPIFSELDFLKKLLFPQVLRTANFAVSILAQNTCEHGNAISNFVRRILDITWPDSNALQPLVESLLDIVIAHTGQANAGQFYILKGILDATANKGKCLSTQHDDRLIKIAHIHTDNILRGDLKMLLCLYLSLRAGYTLDITAQQQQLSTIAQITRNHPHLLDETQMGLVIDALQLEGLPPAFLSTAAASRLGAQLSVSEADIALYSLITAIDFQIRAKKPAREGGCRDDPFRNISGLPKDIYNSVLVQLLRYGPTIQNELQNIPEVRNYISGMFNEIMKTNGSIPQSCEITTLVSLMGFQHADNLRHLAMSRLEDISENWMHGFSSTNSLLQTLKFYLRVSIVSSRRRSLGECSDGLINAIVARTSSFCGEIYDKVKRKKDFHEVIICFLELIEIMISTRGKLPPDLGYYVLITLHLGVLPYIDGVGFSIMLECIEHILVSCPSALQMVENLSELLQEWAIKAAESRLGRDQKSNQARAIGIILHPVVLDASVATGPTLIKICKDIQTHMWKRRGLAPALARALCHAFDVTASTFCREHGFTEVLHEFLLPTAPKMDDNNFDVEEALAVMFDETVRMRGAYEKYHGEKEKIAQARIFDLLARFDYDDAIQELWAKTLLDEIFEPWTEIDPKDPNSLRIVQKWKKTQQLQAVLLLERFITDDDAEDHLEAVFVALSREANPRYKFLLEWIAFRCILRFPEMRSTIWERFENTEEDTKSYIVSLLRLAHLVAVHIKDDMQETFFTELVHRALPCATSNKVTIRHEGAELIPKLFEEATALGYTNLTENKMFKSIYEYVLDSPFRRVRVPAPSPPEAFDPIADFTLVGVLGGRYITSDNGGDIIQVFRSEDFTAFSEQSTTRFIPIGTNPPISTAPAASIPTATDADMDTDTVDKTTKSAATGPVQTKGGDWDPTTLLTRQDALTGRFASRRQSHDLLVIASLVDNNYNLGGICRVSELLGVRQLYVGNKTMALKSREFTSVSVSSENWLPIEEAKKVDVAALIARKRQEGYTVVGIEQTDRSVILGSRGFAFPVRTVLVIGAEKTGIPPELLVEMDICVEVKQFGETRSMNVQTATAVVLYEYARQNGGIQETA